MVWLDGDLDFYVAHVAAVQRSMKDVLPFHTLPL